MNKLPKEIEERFRKEFGAPLTEKMNVQMEGNGDTMLISQKELFSFLTTILEEERERLLNGIIDEIHRVKDPAHSLKLDAEGRLARTAFESARKRILKVIQALSPSKDGEDNAKQ